MGAEGGSVHYVRPDDNRPLALTVGCAFGFETPQPVSAVLQVAPSGRDLQVRAEHWETGADHHGYIDLFGNRCERVTIAAGASQLVYEAEVVLSSPSDRVAPGTPETPIMALPDEHIAFVMPSRFCLPDELGHEAWQRFGDLAPGWERVQAIVDFVHGHLEWMAGASNPWTTAVDPIALPSVFTPSSSSLKIAVRALSATGQVAGAATETSAGSKPIVQNGLPNCVLPEGPYPGRTTVWPAPDRPSKKQFHAPRPAATYSRSCRYGSPPPSRPVRTGLPPANTDAGSSPGPTTSARRPSGAAPPKSASPVPVDQSKPPPHPHPARQRPLAQALPRTCRR